MGALGEATGTRADKWGYIHNTLTIHTYLPPKGSRGGRISRVITPARQVLWAMVSFHGRSVTRRPALGPRRATRSP